MKKWAVALLALAAVGVLHAAPARADGTGSTALAQELYDDAKAAMARADYAVACQKFAESHRLDPATGGTLLNLAACHEKMGLTATAWAEFEEAQQLARHFGRADREKLAHDRIEKLRPRVSRMTVHVADDAAGVVAISVDGMGIGRAAWGSIPVDPGDHMVKAEAPGKLAYSHSITIGTVRETPTVEVPPLKDAPVAVVPRPLPALAAEHPVPTAAEGARSGDSHRATGFLLGGFGAAGVAIGSAFGLAAIHLNHESQASCGSPRVCASDPEGTRALLDANISNVAFGVGIVGLALGTYFVLTAPSKPAPATTGWRSVRIGSSLLRGGGSLGMRAAW